MQMDRVHAHAFSTCGSAYVQKAQAQNQLYTSVFGSNANH